MRFTDVLELDDVQITGLADPTALDHAANRGWVESAIAGITPSTEAVQDIVGTMLVNGDYIDVDYDDTAGTATIHVFGLDAAAIGDFATAADARITAVVNTAFVNALVGVDAETVGGATPAQLRDRSTHSGTQASSTITQATARILGRTTAGAGATEELTAAGVKTFLAIGPTDVAGFDAAAVAAVNAGVIDADTLEGQTAADITTAAASTAVASIIGGASGAYDTLGEIQALMEADDTQTTAILTALGLRVQTYAETIGDGAATTYTITHNLASRDVIVQLYEAAGDYEQVWATIKRPTINTVTVTFASAPAAGEFRVVVQGRAA